MVKTHIVSKKRIYPQENYFLSKIPFKDVAKPRVALLKLIASGRGKDLENKFKNVILDKSTYYAGFRLGKFLKLATCSYSIGEKALITDSMQNREGLGVITVLKIYPHFDPELFWCWKIIYEGVLND